jgi:hypothetical protein
MAGPCRHAPRKKNKRTIMFLPLSPSPIAFLPLVFQPCDFALAISK